MRPLEYSMLTQEYLVTEQSDRDTDNICYQSLFVLFVLLLYVPSQQLWSLRDGQFT